MMTPEQKATDDFSVLQKFSPGKQPRADRPLVDVVAFFRSRAAVRRAGRKQPRCAPSRTGHAMLAQLRLERPAAGQRFSGDLRDVVIPGALAAPCEEASPV